jgi:hypothetical protein
MLDVAWDQFIRLRQEFSDLYFDLTWQQEAMCHLCPEFVIPEVLNFHNAHS